MGGKRRKRLSRSSACCAPTATTSRPRCGPRSARSAAAWYKSRARHRHKHLMDASEILARRPMAEPAQPGRDCPLCPRLVAFRAENRAAFPAWHNAPVTSFGPIDARLLIVGLGPGLKGANRTGRPFTGDFAGDLLYPTLRKFGFAEGTYGRSPDDGFRLIGCRVSNAVRCVPPENKPTPSEIAGCRSFLVDEIASLPRL